MKALLLSAYQAALVIIIMKGLDALAGTHTSTGGIAGAVAFIALWQSNIIPAASAPTGQANEPLTTEAGHAQGNSL